MGSEKIDRRDGSLGRLRPIQRMYVVWLRHCGDRLKGAGEACEDVKL
jgi:hypothetical protein